MSTYLIELHSVSKWFKDNRVITELSHNFKRGSITLLLGENGSGKTTLLKLITGLYKPTSGLIKRHYKDFRYVPELQPITSDMHVITYITHIARLLGVKRNHMLEETLQLELSKPLKSLSKGNTKKVLLYLSFIGSPEVVLMDEPLDGLDVGMQEEILKFIEKNQNITYIISTHREHMFKMFKNREVIHFD